MKHRYSTIALALCLAASLLTACQKAENTADKTPMTAEATATPVADVDQSTARVAQLSLVDGTVSLKPAGDEDWTQATVNQPVFEGTELFADDGANSEVVLGDGRYLRIGDGADVAFTALDPDQVQVDMTAGTATLALDTLESSERYEVSTPDGAIIPAASGEYRIDIDDDGVTWLTVRRGTAHVMTPNGSFDVKEGDRVNLSAKGDASYEVVRYEDHNQYGQSGADDWDSWNDERHVYYTGLAGADHPEAVNSLYGRSDIYGLAALAAAGIWRALDNDRYGWYPRQNPGWSPYENGYWDYSPAVGYTWISNDSWGWAPYHYGRWDYNDGYGWYWTPSDGISTVSASSWRTRYRWEPALVYAFQPQQSTSVVWVPLAYGEPYVAYTQPWHVNSAPQHVTFVPRFLRERRGLVYVPVDGLDRRVRARRADRVVLERVNRFDVAQAQPYMIPRPARIVPAGRVAKVRPSERVRDRAVVVDPQRVSDRRPDRVTAANPRPTRKAETRKVDTRVAAPDAARLDPVPRMTRKGGKMRADRSGERRANQQTQPASARTPSPEAPKARRAPAAAPVEQPKRQAPAATPQPRQRPAAQPKAQPKVQPKRKPKSKPASVTSRPRP